MRLSTSRAIACVLLGASGLIVGLGVHAQTGSPAAPQGKPGVIKTLTMGIPHSAYFGISFDGGKGVAVGFSGSILESNDGGQTWAPVKHDLTKLALLAVDRRGEHTVAVGQSGVVLVGNGGKWSKGDTGGDRRLFSVSVSSGGYGIAVGEFGTVIKTEDGGNTWANAAPDWSLFADPESFGTGEPSMYAAYVSEAGETTIAGEFGVILRSVDRGANWQVLRPVKAGEPTLFAMHIGESGESNSYAVGQSGEMLVSSDHGQVWTRCAINTNLNFLGVTAAADGEVVVTGMRVMMRSQNRGMSWEAIEEGDTTTDWYQTVRTEAGSGRIIAVGHSGKIIQIGM